MAIVPTSAQAPAPARARGRDGPRRRPAGRHPAAVRARAPRGDLDLPARNRQRGNHRHCPRPTATRDPGHSRPAHHAVNRRAFIEQTTTGSHRGKRAYAGQHAGTPSRVARSRGPAGRRIGRRRPDLRRFEVPGRRPISLTPPRTAQASLPATRHCAAATSSSARGAPLGHAAERPRWTQARPASRPPPTAGWQILIGLA